MWRIEFDSDKFLPTLPEEAQANPGVYGFELALWLSVKLSATGLSTGYPLGEDWGWHIEHIDDDSEITVGCGSVTEEGDGYLGKPIHWRVFVGRPLSIKQRLTGRSESPKVRMVAEAVIQVLQAAGESPSIAEER